MGWSPSRVWSRPACDTGPCISDVHREFMPRALSSYMPEEIWRKAGEWGQSGRELGGQGPDPLALSCLQGASVWLGAQLGPWLRAKLAGLHRRGSQRGHSIQGRMIVT